MTNERFSFRAEAKLIPAWGIVLAIIPFIAFEILFPLVIFRGDPGAPPLPLQLLIPLIPGSILALVILLGVYVNQDAKRRGMNRALWTVLVYIVPYAIGFILYFVLRQPLRSPCPQCGTLITSKFNFCPNCKYNLRPACPSCKHEIRPGDHFCPYCAHDLARGEAPGGPSITSVTPPATA